MASSRAVISRGTTALVDAVRKSIAVGRIRPGEFVPAVRQLSGEHGVSPETVRRGLKHLEAEGLLVAEPRQGFRVAAPAARPAAHGPVAYVTDHSPDLSDAQPANWALSAALQQAAAQQGWTTLGARCGTGAPVPLAEQLSAGRAWGLVLDTLNPGVVGEVAGLACPAVMVNSWIEGCALDVVLQDNYLGGFLAASQLVDAGAERIAWLGPVGSFCHSRERFAGAVAGLAARGKSLAPEMVADTTRGEAEAAARGLLDRPGRPDAVLCFWKGAAKAMMSVAEQLKLEIGGDLLVVGWSVEEAYESEHLAVYAGGAVPPAVVWKASTMAERALALLAERRAGRAGEPVRVCVPARLKLSE